MLISELDTSIIYFKVVDEHELDKSDNPLQLLLIRSDRDSPNPQLFNSKFCTLDIKETPLRYGAKATLR